jgi:hypothetical protein
MPPIHYRLPKPTLLPSVHPLSPPILTYLIHPPPIQNHPHTGTPSHGRCPTLTRNESVRTKTRKGGKTYYRGRAAESTPTAHSDDAHHTSRYDDRMPRRKSNDPVQNAGRHRQGRDARNSQMSRKRQGFDKRGRRGKTP